MPPSTLVRLRTLLERQRRLFDSVSSVCLHRHRYSSFCTEFKIFCCPFQCHLTFRIRIASSLNPWKSTSLSVCTVLCSVRRCQQFVVTLFSLFFFWRCKRLLVQISWYLDDTVMSDGDPNVILSEDKRRLHVIKVNFLALGNWRDINNSFVFVDSMT